jgi:uncharacterized membrane protein HdeD (DUF308 family)
MKKSFPVYIYGTIIIFGGVFLLFSQYSTFNSIRTILAITLAIGTIFSFLTALSRQKKQVEFAYHEMHALAMLIYGVSVFFFCDKLETLIYFTSSLFFFCAFSEIAFCNWLFNLEKKVVHEIVMIRVFLGLVVGIGTIVIMNHYNMNSIIALAGYGVLFIIIGISILLYVPIVKTNELEEAFK